LEIIIRTCNYNNDLLQYRDVWEYIPVAHLSSEFDGYTALQAGSVFLPVGIIQEFLLLFPAGYRQAESKNSNDNRDSAYGIQFLS